MNNHNSSEHDRGNTVFHIALNPDGTLQPIIDVILPFDVDILKCLLSTDRPGGTPLDNPDGTGYLFVYDNNKKKPYPSVMIWKYRKGKEYDILQDMRPEDLRIIPYAVDTYLK